MNPVLSYALKHQAHAKRLLAGRYYLPPEDVEDVSQEVLIAIWRANPQSDGHKPARYWATALRRQAIARQRTLRRQSSIGLPLLMEPSDPREDPEATAMRRESIREALTVATPHQRHAVIVMLTEPVSALSSTTKVALCRLRHRLRERAAA